MSLRFLLAGICLYVTVLMHAQQGWWGDVEDVPAGESLIFPIAWRTIRADTMVLRQILAQAPREREVNVSQSPVRISFPLPDGASEVFAIVQYDMMEPGLSAEFPQFITCRGVSLRNSAISIHLDWTLRGLSATIFYPDQESVFFEPLLKDNLSYYAVFRKSDYPKPNFPWTCEVQESPKDGLSPHDSPKAGDCVFRAYRLAVATTAEYSNFHGAADSTESGEVLSAVVTAVNRLNQVYSRDIAVRMILVEGNNRIFYYNPATDPYTNDSPSDMLDENQTTIDAVIGSGNYDIGHVFGTAGGGLAFLNAPCTNRKAKGMTGLSSPVGDPFYIDYVAHEIGHQFGGNHTQNNDCNRAAAAAFEPGSASTIMGYAGICDPNVQNFSDPYFHAISIQEMTNFVTGNTGNSCATPIFSPNAPPEITPLPEYVIPHSTPFVLTASASDPDQHPLTYCWEQWDNEAAPMPPQPSQTQGPSFRSFLPSASPSRYFPRLQDIHSSPTWEVLPAVARSLSFRATVRDFNDTFGCTTETQADIEVEGSAGPFIVTYPDTLLDWQEGLRYVVMWDVAGTHLAPISCEEVEIWLSYDDGLTFPVLLASGTANDGEQPIVLPAGTTNKARIMVRCANNIFFNVTRTNFRILPATAPDYAFYAVPETSSSCVSDVAYTILTSALQGFSEPIQFTVSGLPAGATASFSTNPVIPSDTALLTVSGISNIVPGNYPLTITATTSTGFKTFPVFLVVLAAPDQAELVTPANQAVDQSVRPLLSWNAALNAANYRIEIATDEAFQQIVRQLSAATTQIQITEMLQGATTYFWRVRGVSPCTQGPWSAIYRFTTGPCLTFMSSDVPLEISSEIDSIFSALQIDAPGAVITDLNIVQLSGTHTWVSDLRFSLIGPDSIVVPLFGPVCSNEWDFNLNLDQEAPVGAIPCPPTTGLSYRPSGDLSVLYGRELNGQWTLKVLDVWQQDGGVLESWGMEVCMTGYQDPLPVTWLDFLAKPADKAIQLSWITASEQDNAGFEVERSEGFPGDFKSIAWIQGEGTTFSESRYGFLDTQVRPGIPYYYRLRQMDFDGHFQYSEIRTASLEDAGEDSRVFPNPAGQEFFVELPDSSTGDIVLELFDARGSLLEKRQSTSSLERFPAVNLPRGSYLVRVSTSGIVKTWRVVLH